MVPSQIQQLAAYQINAQFQGELDRMINAVEGLAVGTVGPDWA